MTQLCWVPSGPPEVVIGDLFHAIEPHHESIAAVGISVGGPLDAELGKILDPPNLPEWHHFDIVQEVEERLKVQAFLMNDANASALAEWKYGAGRGASDLAFLTCGTGIGAGLILGGTLHEGASGQAGEIGHIKLTRDGPLGYGVVGSVEGWCSGAGIAVQANGRTAKDVAESARARVPEDVALWRIIGERLGQSLAILVDLLNVERIVIGGIFPRCEDLIRPSMEAALKAAALPSNLASCKVCAAQLGDGIGDYAAVCVAEYFEQKR